MLIKTSERKSNVYEVHISNSFISIEPPTSNLVAAAMYGQKVFIGKVYDFDKNEAYIHFISLMAVCFFFQSSNCLSCVKSVQQRSFSGPYFPAFGLNRERYGVSLCIQSECGKIRTRKNSVFGHFSRGAWVLDDDIRSATPELPAAKRALAIEHKP